MKMMESKCCILPTFRTFAEMLLLHAQLSPYTHSTSIKCKMYHLSPLYGSTMVYYKRKFLYIILAMISCQYHSLFSFSVNIVTFVLYLSAASANKEGNIYLIDIPMRQVLTNLHLHVNFHYISGADNNAMNGGHNVSITLHSRRTISAILPGP